MGQMMTTPPHPTPSVYQLGASLFARVTHTHRVIQTEADLEKYLDDPCDYREFGELNCAKDLYSLIEQFLYVAKQTAVHAAA